MSNFEKPTPIKAPEKEAQDLYMALPEGMKTKRFGLVREKSEYHTSREEIDGDKLPAPAIVVTFKHGGRIELHPDNTQAPEAEFDTILGAGEGVENIARVELLWRAIDRA